ncbi:MULTISPECIES: transcriptional activator NhaR [unclassified Duganella]|jgi:LysR family transcriptional activator of nhaA|uniref:transcriptional activator NhaR n=1 Tax=unclassified Duganella TaxID=2636909 RepID=UPI000885F39C|nr:MULTISPECIES: transcriptional activator NhaR [unclassified Duganella]SDG68601.1 LysR family transcriptional regulator, transcriptional activator of nhaA [Duganella sp. OV458]SDJ93938.1 LysR family transcriptional regulator, transcriptional activator of nhaA [Duganella sp. OV510]
MKTSGLNFRHLYFFWMVAKEGGVTRAAERLGLAVQTISMQIASLEKTIGKQLLEPQGRRLVPTEAGRLALSYCEQIFALGEQLREALDEAETGKMRLAVGISDSLPKLIAFRLLQATQQMDTRVHLVCMEDEFENLLADLALGKLDVVLTDRTVRAGGSLKVFSHLLGESDMKLFGTPKLARKYRRNFPHSLQGAPLLLPTRNNALRGRIDAWLLERKVRPEVVAEFEDNAMLNTFGRNGLGLFFAPSALAEDIEDQFGAVLVGDAPELREHFYAISNARKITHPAIEAIINEVHSGLLAT